MSTTQSKRWNLGIAVWVIALCLFPSGAFAYDLVLTPTQQFHIGEGLAEFDFVYLPNGQSAYAKKLDATASSLTQYTRSQFTILPRTGDLGRVEVVDVQVTLTRLGVGGGTGCSAIHSVTPYVNLWELCNNSTTQVVPLKTNVQYAAEVNAAASGYPSEQFTEIRFQLPAEQRAESISAGLRHTCGLHSDGTLHCWGWNGYGQTNAPAGSFTAVSAGGYHTCAVKSDSTLTCWGSDNEGQSTAPTGAFAAVSAGDQHTCGLRGDGTVTCWGSDNSGQATAPAGTFVAVSAGSFHTCGVHSDGTLACWGSNYQGQSTPPAGSFTAVSAGTYYTCGLRSDGTLACWGNNDFGRASPPAGTFIGVSAANARTCGVRGDGTLACWGNNDLGRATPPAGAFHTVSVGSTHACAVRSDDTLTCWGDDSFGQAPQPQVLPSTLPQGAIGAGYSQQLSLVDVASASSEFPYLARTPAFVRTAGALPPGLDLTVVGLLAGTPTAVGNFDFTVDSEDANGFVATGNYALTVSGTAPPVPPPQRLAAGNLHMCRIRTDGTLGCWGWNAYGQNNAPAGTFVAVSAGSAHSCAIRTDRTIVCWGNNEYGQLTTPTGTFTTLGAGGLFACAVRDDGTLACWGDNAAGQLSPPAGSFVAVDAGQDYACALRTNGTIACWGGNTAGQSAAPAGTFTAIAAGGQHTCALRTDGTLACWGQNIVQPTPAGTFVRVSVGGNGACAMRADGTATCWGVDSHGSTQAAAGAFDAIASGGESNCASRADGTLACWGYDFYGDAPSLSLTPTTLPAAMTNLAYLQALGLQDVGNSASPGFPYLPPTPAFAIVSGSLPPGLTLTPDGVLAGTATASGNYNFGIEAEDANGFVGTRSYSMTVLVGVSDDSAPTVTPVLTGTLGQAGWYVGDVTIAWTVEDADSAILSSSGCGTLVQTTDTSGSTYQCTATSVGGTATGSVTIKRDATPPTLSPTVTPASIPQQGSGVAAANAADAMSGLANQSCAALDTTTLGTRTVTCTASDNAGNVATATASYAVVDASAPTITPLVTGTLGQAGWYVDNVSIAWTVEDVDSAILSTSGCSTLARSMDTSGMIYTCTATSAGGTSTGSVTIKRDATQPTLAPTVTPSTIPLNGSAVAAANAADATSGLFGQSCQPLNTATVGSRTVVCVANDNAGNVNNATATYTVVDPTPPQVVETVTGTLGNNGWYRSDVSVTWAVTDDSPILSSSGCGATVVSTDNSGVQFTCTATSSGGTTVRSVYVKRDVTRPVIFAVNPLRLLLNASTLIPPETGDATAGLWGQSCAPPQTSTVGYKSVQCTSTDLAGNSITFARNYYVIYGFTGFAAPLNKWVPGMHYTAKKNSLIPFRWRVTDANGAPVTNITQATFQGYRGDVSCGNKSVALTEYGKGTTALRNLGNGYYEMNLPTGSPSGYCNGLSLRLTLTAYEDPGYGWVVIEVY